MSTDRYISRFLLVSLNIDAVLRGTTIRRRRQNLNAMTDGLGLGGAYSETLNRIKEQGEEESRLGMATLMWISHAERPLKVDELCHALGVEIGSTDLDGDNVPSLGKVLVCCQGLVSVDKKASTVRLIHFTLQEYLQPPSPHRAGFIVFPAPRDGRSVIAHYEAGMKLPGSFHCGGIDLLLKKLPTSSGILCDVTVEGILILPTGGFDLFFPKIKENGATLLKANCIIEQIHP